jgi:hypothetical protein
LPVNDGRAKATDGVRKIDGVGLAKIFAGKDAFFGVGVGGEDVTAMDTGEQAAGYGRCEETAIFLHENVVDGALGDFAAFIQEEGIVVSGGGCGVEGFCIKRAGRGFVEVHRIVGIDGMGGEAHAEEFG